MLFQKKIDRCFRKLEEDSKSQGGAFRESDEKLEKKDVLAMIISAFAVFGPIFLVLGIILYLCI